MITNNFKCLVKIMIPISKAYVPISQQLIPNDKIYL